MKSAALLLVVLLARAHGASVSPQRVEVLLNKAAARAAELGALGEGLAVTPQKLILLSGDRRMLLVGWGGVQPLDGMRLGAFAYTPDGLLMGVRGLDLVAAQPDGSLKTLFALPSAGMGLAAGVQDNMFLFERAPLARHGLYELTPGRKILKLLDSPEPIGAVAQAADGRLFFAAGSAVYELAPGKPMRLLAGGGKTIRALAVDPKSGRVYGSDGACVFALDGGRLTLVARHMGGALAWLDGGLIVFDARAPLLARLAGL